MSVELPPRVIEPLIVFSTAYYAFILAECIHWSGIISLIGCGLVQKRYAFPNISKKSYTTVKYGVKTLASFMDCIIFLYLGIVTIKHTKEWHTGFVLWTIVLCTAVRLVLPRGKSRTEHTHYDISTVGGGVPQKSR